jgi:hypothetical protein
LRPFRWVARFIFEGEPNYRDRNRVNHPIQLNTSIAPSSSAHLLTAYPLTQLRGVWRGDRCRITGCRDVSHPRSTSRRTTMTSGVVRMLMTLGIAQVCLRSSPDKAAAAHVRGLTSKTILSAELYRIIQGSNINLFVVILILPLLCLPTP